MANRVRCDYDEVESCISRISGLLEQAQEFENRLLNGRHDLVENGGWQGIGVAAFASEMDSLTQPAIAACIQAFEITSDSIGSIAAKVSAADQDAAHIFVVADGL